MRLNRVLVAMALLATSEAARAQIADGETFREAYKSTAILGAVPPAPVPGHTYNIILGTPTIPLTFSRVEKIQGEYRIGAALELGLGYSVVQGKALYNADGTISVDPELLAGLAVNVGARNGDTKLDSSLSLSGIIGFSRVALTTGYDLLNKSWFFGLCTKVDTFSFTKTGYTAYKVWDNP